MFKKIYEFIRILLLLLVAYFIFKVYIQEAVIWNSGSGGSEKNIGNGYLKFNVSLELKEALKLGGAGLGAAAVVKACPPQSRPVVALGLGVLAATTSVINNYIDKGSSNNGVGGSDVGSSNGDEDVNEYNCESCNTVSKSVWDELSNILARIMDKVFGAPINCEEEGSSSSFSFSSWNPMDYINEALMGFSEEEKFFIALILMLIVVLYVSIGIMLSVLIRLIFNKPFQNKYLEKIRIFWSQSNNITLIVLFLMQWYGIIYSIYALCVYIGFIYYS